MSPRKKLRPERWSLGVDPGFGGTGLVLLADDVPIAAALATDKGTRPVQERTRAMALWFYETIETWIEQYEIELLHVVIEEAYLRRPGAVQQADRPGHKGRVSVKTLARQMRMISAYEHMLYEVN